jgi:uncharacterized protein with HEPN domain
LSRKPEDRIRDIISSCEKIVRFSSGRDAREFFEDEVARDAVLWNLQIIGEATKHLPDDVRARMPGMEWKKIAGMRDWLAHVYFRVDPDIVWNVIRTEVPALLGTLVAYLGEERVAGESS